MEQPLIQLQFGWPNPYTNIIPAAANPLHLISGEK